MSNNFQQIIQEATDQLEEHPLFAVLSELVYVHCNNKLPPATWAQLHETRYAATLHVNQKKKLSVDEWVYVLALGYLHVAMGHLLVKPDTEAHKLHALYQSVHHFAQQMSVGKRPANMQDSDGIGGKLAPWINEHQSYFYHYEKETRWQEVFDREQFLLLKTEDLKARPEAVFRRVFAFLGVDETWQSPLIGQEFHRGGDAPIVDFRKLKAVPILGPFARWVHSRLSEELQMKINTRNIRVSQKSPRALYPEVCARLEAHFASDWREV